MRSVTVDQSSFAEMTFRGASPKLEFGTEDQKLRNDVPVWDFRVQVAEYRRNGELIDDLIRVSVASPTNPAETLRRGEPIRFDRLVYGFATTKSGGTSWMMADAILSARTVKQDA